MNHTIIRPVLLLFVVTMSLVTGVASFAQDDLIPQQLRAALSQSLEVASGNQLQIVLIEPTLLPGIFLVELNSGEILYSDASGSYLFAGDMYQTNASGLVNLSAPRRQQRNLERIAAVPESEMIVFEPETVKSGVTVFTDVDCTYCRALHREIDELLALGIRVRYLAYPRGGEQAGSYEKMISVWCSEDPHKSLTQAKNGQNLPVRDCESPVLSHYELGNEIGISGTPALILPDGRVVPGYVEAPRLAVMLGIDTTQ